MTQFISIGGSPSYLLASIGPSVYSETRLFTYQELTNALADKLVSPSLLAIDFVNIKLLLAAVAPGSPFHSQHYHCCRTASNSAGLQVATQLHTGIAISRNISTPMTDVGTGEIKVIRDGECVSRISAEDYNSLLTQESRIAYLELLNPNAYHFGTAASRKMGDSIAITIEDEAACELLAIEATTKTLGVLRGKLSYGMGSLQGYVDGVLHTADIGVMSAMSAMDMEHILADKWK
jgi:hypothetical protein